VKLTPPWEGAQPKDARGDLRGEDDAPAVGDTLVSPEDPDAADSVVVDASVGDSAVEDARVKDSIVPDADVAASVVADDATDSVVVDDAAPDAAESPDTALADVVSTDDLSADTRDGGVQSETAVPVEAGRKDVADATADTPPDTRADSADAVAKDAIDAADATDAGSVCTGQIVGAGIDAGLAQGLIAYYPSESASGAYLPDLSGLDHNATLVTGTAGATGYSFITGEVGKALSLVAANKGYVVLPQDLLINACEVTVASWVYINNKVDWQRVFDFGKDTNVYMFLATSNGATGFLRFGITKGGNNSAYEQVVDGTAAFPVLAWHHVAVVLGSAGGLLYLDGTQVGANAAMTLRPADLGSLPNYYIGRSQFAVDTNLDGDIDEFRVYSRALSPSEIQKIASASCTGIGC